MKKNKIISFIAVAMVFVAIGVGLIAYCNNWAHNIYEMEISGVRRESLIRNGVLMTEKEYGNEYGYYDAAKYGSPICFILALSLIGAGFNLNGKAYKEALRKFYNECKSGNISDMTAAKDKAKAELIADKYGLKNGNVADLYSKGRAMVEGENANKAAKENEDRLNMMMAAEREAYEKCTKYANLRGRDKRVKMLTDLRAEYISLASQIRSNSNAMLSATQQKEIDWATHGGIAAGIAGGAAGVAVAVDAQIKNAQIRSQNKAALHAVADVYLDRISEAANYEKQAEALDEKINEAKSKLVCDTLPDEAKESIAVTTKSVDVSETGAFAVNANVRFVKDAVIYGDVPAALDGTILASVSQNGTQIGTLQLVLPIYGVDDEAVVCGIGLSGAKRGVPCDISYSVDNLWLIEK